MDRLIKNKKGQSLFEVLIAVAVTATTLVAIISLIGSTINNTNFSRDRTLAANHTESAYEYIRELRDNSWNNFVDMADADGNVYCLDSLPENFQVVEGSCDDGEYIQNSRFIREMVLTYNQTTDPNVVFVDIYTQWNDSSGLHESRVSTSLSNWRTN